MTAVSVTVQQAPSAEAFAASGDGRLHAVGSSAAVLDLAGADTAVHDLAGAFVTPVSAKHISQTRLSKPHWQQQLFLEQLAALKELTPNYRQIGDNC